MSTPPSGQGPAERRQVYLDHHATTPCDPRVLDAMLPYFTTRFGNAASTTHAPGRAAMEAVAAARVEVATLIGASPKEIIFTSGATEALNLALQGLVAFAGPGQEIVASPTEHPAVLDTLAALADQGHRVTFLPLGSSGRVAAADVRAAIGADTLAVVVMAANNEIGTVNPIAEIGAVCREAGAILLSDAVQAAGWIPLDVNAQCVDLLALSAHKIYGPKGVGALYVRRRGPRVRLAPLIHGGGHERGLRSGTANVPGIVGFGRAAVLAREELGVHGPRVAALRDRLLETLGRELSGMHVHGEMTHRLPHNLNVSFDGVEGRVALELMPDLALSSGSACATADEGASHVLAAIGAPERLAFGALRFGLGRGTTEAEIDYAAGRIIETVNGLRGG